MNWTCTICGGEVVIGVVGTFVHSETQSVYGADGHELALDPPQLDTPATDHLVADVDRAFNAFRVDCRDYLTPKMESAIRSAIIAGYVLGRLRASEEANAAASETPLAEKPTPVAPKGSPNA